MFRKITISLLVAALAISLLAVTVSAQERGQGAGFNGDGPFAGAMEMRNRQQNADGTWSRVWTHQRSMNQNNDGTCVNFVDEDGDGVCDYAGQQLGRQSMAGRGMFGDGTGGPGFRNGGEPLHRFGDGVCDHETPPRDGTGNQYGQSE